MSITLSHAAPSAEGVRLRPLHAGFGAEVLGLDLAAPLPTGMLDVLHDALVEYGVLLLRGQQALPESLARGIASLEAAPAAFAGASPDMAPPDAAGRPIWHADRSFAAEPSLACLMRAEATGGSIAFADQRAALASLPPALRARLESLRALHVAPLDPAQRAEHPLVRRHPVTGEASLYASPGFTTRILNLPEAESRRLLQIGFAAATAADLTWRHDWRAGDVLIWDNRSILHSGGNGAVLRIEGDRPAAALSLDMPWVMAG